MPEVPADRDHLSEAVGFGTATQALTTTLTFAQITARTGGVRLCRPHGEWRSRTAVLSSAACFDGG